jgi:hypothetical protein
VPLERKGCLVRCCFDEGCMQDLKILSVGAQHADLARAQENEEDKALKKGKVKNKRIVH